MNKKYLIPTHVLCSHYNIEISFVDALHNFGLIQIELVDENQFIHQDRIGDLEKIIRLHNELNMNLESIDIVFNLLEKERALQQELNMLRTRLMLYENE